MSLTEEQIAHLEACLDDECIECHAYLQQELDEATEECG